MGYNQTSETFLESVGVAQLTVTITMPPGADTSFSLLVNTLDGTATGLEFRD